MCVPKNLQAGTGLGGPALAVGQVAKVPKELDGFIV
jgi:hypothetical protein